jgi:hypothetical protein
MPRSTSLVVLPDSQQKQLEKWLAALGTPQQIALRCRIICATGSGESEASIAARLSINRKTMEAAPLIRYFLALGAVWNIDWSYCSSADTKLSQAVCGDECHFPLDSRPAPGTVHLFVRVFKARNC